MSSAEDLGGRPAGMVRCVLRVEPLASAPVDTVVAALGPTVQRYLTGDLS